MKRIIAVLLTVILMTTLSVNIYADNQTGFFDFIIDGIDVHVESCEDEISEELAYRMARVVVYGDIPSLTRDYWCSMNGHQMQTGKVSKVRHCVYSSSPRCVKDTYEVSTCTRCEYSTSTLLTSVRITCC